MAEQTSEASAHPVSESEVSIINADQWPKFDGFRPLNAVRKEIRLLQFRAGGHTDEVACNIRHASLEERPSYCALSYYWGPPVSPSALKPITIESTPVFVRPTLHSFLRSLIGHHPQLTIWLDAVCINQKNARERGEQVSLMGEIFAAAQAVYAWIGEADADSDYVFDNIGYRGNPERDTHVLAQSMEQIFWRPYWSRTWVVQEFGLAQKIRLVAGTRIEDWRNLLKTADILGEKTGTEGWKTFLAFKSLEKFQGKVNNGGTLLNLMQLFRNSRCKDTRDRVFALLSLARDGTLLTPGYTKSTADLYFQLLSLMHMKSIRGLHPESGSLAWPHEGAVRLRRYLPLSQREVLRSLRSSISDRLLMILNRKHIIPGFGTRVIAPLRTRTLLLFHSIFPYRVTLRDKRKLYATADLRPGDVVYELDDGLHRSDMTIGRLYVAFRPEPMRTHAVGLLTNTIGRSSFFKWLDRDVSLHEMRLIQRIVLRGIVRCSRTVEASQDERGVFHTTRIALVLVWLLRDHRALGSLWSAIAALPDGVVDERPRCDCVSPSAQLNDIEVQMNLLKDRLLSETDVNYNDTLAPFQSAGQDERVTLLSSIPLWDDTQNAEDSATHLSRVIRLQEAETYATEALHIWLDAHQMITQTEWLSLMALNSAVSTPGNEIHSRSKIMVRQSISSDNLLIPEEALLPRCKYIEVTETLHLTASCETRDGRWQKSSINLNCLLVADWYGLSWIQVGVVKTPLHVGHKDSPETQARWMQRGNLSHIARDVKILHTGRVVLEAEVKRLNRKWATSAIALDNRIYNDNGDLKFCFECPYLQLEEQSN